RKWPERRIALWALGVSIFSLIATTVVGGFFSWNSNKLSERTFCLGHVIPKIETVKSNITELPKLISGCALEPTVYCSNARAMVSKTKGVVVEINGSLDERISSIARLEGALERVGNLLVDTTNG